MNIETLSVYLHMMKRGKENNQKHLKALNIEKKEMPLEKQS